MGGRRVYYTYNMKFLKKTVEASTIVYSDVYDHNWAKKGKSILISTTL